MCDVCSCFNLFSGVMVSEDIRTERQEVGGVQTVGRYFSVCNLSVFRNIYGTFGRALH